MCTVAELKAYLENIPDDAVVEVLVRHDHSYTISTYYQAVTLDQFSDTELLIHGKFKTLRLAAE